MKSMKPKRKSQIDTDETDSAYYDAAAGTANDQIGAVGVHVDPETLTAYKRYLRDWREGMATWRAIERYQMGRPSRAFSGERCL